MDIGINLSPVNDYNREWVFSDIFIQSREWRLIKNGVVQPPSVKVPVLANGYPDWTALASSDAVQCLMLVDYAGHYPKGTYVASWLGDSTGVVFKGPGVTMDTIVRDSLGKWTAKIDIQGDNGVTLELRQANVTEMSVIMPGGDSRTFHPTFANALPPFKFIRFLNWMNTNSVLKPYTWADRTTLKDVRQSYKPQGVALEAMIALCNQVKSRPWFCMPHLAEDDFIRRFATMAKKLSKSDKIYVEFSNETWNTDFPVHTWAVQQASATGTIWPYVVADAAKHMWDIWLDVFKDNPGKIVRVVGGHVVNDWVAKKVLERLNGQADVIALAAYFSVPTDVAKTFNSSTTATQVLDAARATIDTRMQGLAKHKLLGKPVGFYEGGQGIIAGTSWQQAAYDAQNLPAMYDAVKENLTKARDGGAEFFGAFSYVSRQDSPHGSWGHFSGQEQVLLISSAMRQQAPKAAALRDVILGK